MSNLWLIVFVVGAGAVVYLALVLNLAAAKPRTLHEHITGLARLAILAVAALALARVLSGGARPDWFEALGALAAAFILRHQWRTRCEVRACRLS